MSELTYPSVGRLTGFIAIAIPALLAIDPPPLPAGAGDPRSATPAPSAVETEFREMSFDEAADGLLARSMPLRVALPKRYELFKNEPKSGNWLWTTRKSREYLRKHTSAAPPEGVFQIRISPNVAYDRDRDEFICGPDCGEAAILNQIKEVGATNIRSDRATVNGIPMLLVEATLPAVAGYPPGRIHTAYLATLMDTNSVLFSYTAPANNPGSGERAWKAFEKALLARK